MTQEKTKKEIICNWLYEAAKELEDNDPDIIGVDTDITCCGEDLVCFTYKGKFVQLIINVEDDDEEVAEEQATYNGEVV